MQLRDNLYDMELNDIYKVGKGVYYVRVPGGWVMESSATGLTSSNNAIVFIPYNEEFKPKEHSYVPTTKGPEPRR
jgi:hypothetical protein